MVIVSRANISSSFLLAIDLKEGKIRSVRELVKLPSLHRR